MEDSHGTRDAVLADVCERYKTYIDEKKLANAPAEAQLVVRHYVEILALARAELHQLEADIASSDAPQAARLKIKADELRGTIKKFWVLVGPYQLH